ncbi:MAG: transglutaminase-like domain-containing protein [Thermoproteota archaeon]|nr:hypothetical protein [Candidatus Brockarchaeota archaeon]
MGENRPVKIIYCKRCSFPNPADSNFCGRCGLPLKSTQAIYASTQDVPRRKTSRWRLAAILLVISNIMLFCWFLYQISECRYKYEALSFNYGVLENRFYSLEQDYNSLENRYSSLEREKAFMEEWYNTIRNQINLRSGGGDEKLFVTPDDPMVSSIVVQTTGGWSNTVNPEEYWEDLEKMYDWVATNVKYSYDSPYPFMPEIGGSVWWSIEVWRFPNETIRDRLGDCEDQALLLASMIRNYGGKKYAVWVIEWVGASSAHLAVAVPVLGGDLAILDPTGRFYTKDQYGRLAHKYSGLAVKEWIDYWSTQQKNIQITLALSDTEHQTFSSTNEFIEWASTSVNPSPPKSFFLLYEKIEIMAAFPEPVVGGWKVHIIYVNTGSKSTGIDGVFINNVPYSSGGATLNVTLPIDANIGVQKSFYIYIPAGATYGGQRIVSSAVISIKLHSTGGKEYFTSVVLP